MNNELYLRTAFSCMACDGEIANEEVDLIRKYVNDSNLFDNLEVEKLLNEYIESINTIGMSFLNSYLKQLQNEEHSKEDEMKIVKIAFAMIEADKVVQYSEVKFFKRIRACLSLSDDEILKEFPDKEDFLLPDIIQNDYELILDTKFSAIQLKVA